jgi:Ricin-type beta-trefoil lectin domain
MLRFYRDISVGTYGHGGCLDVYGEGEKRDIRVEKCHFGQGNQYFRYDMDTMQIYHSAKHLDRCVEIHTETYTVFETKCNSTSNTQKFRWGFVNETNIRNWLGYGSRIVSQQEIIDLTKLKQN